MTRPTGGAWAKHHMDMQTLIVALMISIVILFALLHFKEMQQSSKQQSERDERLDTGAAMEEDQLKEASRLWPWYRGETKEAVIAVLKEINLTLNEAANLSDRDLIRLSSLGHHWVYCVRTVQIAADIETPIVNRERFYRQAKETGLREDISNALANASLSVESTASMSDEQLSCVKGLGRCGLSILRGKQVELEMQSFHITMYKLSRLSFDLGISQRGVGMLMREKLTLEDTSKLNDAELSEFPGVARGTVGEIRQLEMVWFPDF